MASKVKIKAGSIEIEFEGSEEYMKNELPGLVELLCSIGPAPENEDEEESQELKATADHSKRKLTMTTNTISSRLGATKGNDVVMAACTHLSLVKGADKFTRSDILTEMKSASNYYKKNMSKNLSALLKTLVTQHKLLETDKDTYALEAATKTELETQLSGN